MTEFNEGPKDDKEKDMNVLEGLFIQLFMGITLVIKGFEASQEQLEEILTRVSNEQGDDEALSDDVPDRD